MDGVTITVKNKTRRNRIEMQRMLLEIDTDDAILRDEYSQYCYLVAHTESVEVDATSPALEEIAHWWAMVNDDETSVMAWCEYFMDIVTVDFWDAWWKVHNDKKRAWTVSPAEASPELLTEEELADPK